MSFRQEEPLEGGREYSWEYAKIRKKKTPVTSIIGFLIGLGLLEGGTWKSSKMAPLCGGQKQKAHDGRQLIHRDTLI